MKQQSKRMIHRLGRADRIGLLVTALAMSSLHMDIVLTSPLTTSSVPGITILDNLSGVLFNTFNNLLDATRPLGGGPGDSSFDLFGECQDDSNNSSSCLPVDPDARRTVPQIIESRGFKVQELPVVTRDGYILSMHRIVNPLVPQNQRSRLRPVILQHGLMTSSVDWVINSMEVRPKKIAFKTKRANGNAGPPQTRRDHPTMRELLATHQARGHDSDNDHPNGLGFYLANEGYDVFLANSRGNIYGQRHVNLSSWEPSFWDFTFDHLIKYDLPATVEHVQRLTGRKKVAYVGHSQGTAIMFGLLSDRPEYADVFEPIIMLAPVAYVGNVVSPARYFSLYTPIFQHVNTRFGTSSTAVRYLAPIVCGPQVVRKELCSNLIFLSGGFNEAEFNATRLSAYLAHLPSGTSVKNLAHYGQEVNSGRFAHFDHGRYLNQKLYGQEEAPDYPLARVRSRSLVLFTADNDWLSTPKDVAKLRASLRVKPYRTYNMTEFKPKWNHVDFMYGRNSGRLVNTRVLQVLREFDNDQDNGNENGATTAVAQNHPSWW